MTTIATALLLSLLGCGSPAPEPPPSPPGPDIVLVTLDTTRADRIGAYGYAGARTPVIDALAGSGRRYARAYSPIPLTIPAHAAILTGRYPARFGLRDNGGASLPQEATTLAEVLREHGYVTAASVAAFVTTRRWGFDQGFDTYLDDVPISSEHNFWHASRPGAAVVDDAIAWSAAQTSGAPRFLWVHLYDPHFPYAADPSFGPELAERRYDAEIAYVDAQVGRLVAAFEGRPTLFVLAADHGESLGEHGELTHGFFVFESTQRVPVIVSGPGVASEVVQTPVSLVDVMPIALAAAGLAAPGDLDGSAVPDPNRPVYLESYQLRDRFGVAPHVAVVQGDLKLVDVPRPELYDVAADPAEQADRSATDPEAVGRLAASLAAFGFEPPTSDAAHPIEPDIADQLAALGYVQGGFDGDASALPDPKDRRRVVGLSQRAEHLQHEGHLEAAAGVLATLIEENPDVTEFRTRLAGVFSRLGRADEAYTTLQDAVARDPENVSARYVLAGQMAQRRQFREAHELYLRAAEEMPYAPRARALAMATLLSVPDGRDEAVALGRRYLAEHPDDAGVAGLLGVELSRRGDPEGHALVVLGMSAKPPEVDVAATLAEREITRGDLVEGRRLLEVELDAHPRNQRAGTILLRILVQQKDLDAQIAWARRLRTASPDRVAFWHAEAQALFNASRYAESRTVVDEALEVAPGASMLLLLDANLLAKEGRMEEGKARFEEANRAREREELAQPG